jgi:LCP family protein required for cell wall assembly
MRGSEINLVSARSGINTEFNAYSRNSQSAKYSKQRARSRMRRNIIIGVAASVCAIAIAIGVFFAVLVTDADSRLHEGLDLPALDPIMTDRERPEDPFYILLLGTDDADEGVARCDTIILARIDPAHKAADLVSIPRDTRVNIPGYGYQKINSAYAWGMVEDDSNFNLAVEYAINAVSGLTGVTEIAGFAQVDFSGFKAVVDALGGVEVDVPVDIIGDRDAGPVDVYAGRQRLDGEHAMVFVRSRDFPIGDYQRQADQRIFLQALAKQILAAEPMTIFSTVSSICDMTMTNLSVSDIAAIAQSMRGMQETDIYTYSIPCTSDTIDGSSFEVPDTEGIKALMKAIDAGEHPDPDSLNLTRQGEAPDSYKPQTSSSTQPAPSQVDVNTGDFTVEVRNGYGIQGSATSVSDSLVLAGYKRGNIGNASSMVYTETLIIYQEDTDKDAATDIQSRLGFGRVIPSNGRYDFTVNILVVVGGDFKP